MSDYDKRYNVCSNMVSHYTDDPREALRLLEQPVTWGPYPSFCTEGGSSDHDFDQGVMITRWTKGPVTAQQLRLRILLSDYKKQRAVVQQMIADLKAVQ